MILTSPLPKIEIPQLTLPEVVLRKTLELGDKPALIDGPSGHSISYKELGEKSKRIASSLARRGTTKKKGRIVEKSRGAFGGPKKLEREGRGAQSIKIFFAHPKE